MDPKKCILCKRATAHRIGEIPVCEHHYEQYQAEVREGKTRLLARLLQEYYLRR